MILKCFLGGLLGLGLTSSARAAVLIIDSFEAGEGHFTSSPTGSGTSTGFVVANTTIDQDTTTGQNSSASQKFVVDDDPAVNITTTFNWRIRNLSGGGTPANNTSFATTGFVGYWLKTTTPNLQASIVIDDGAQTERGNYLNINADGQWHAYEWNLAATTASTEWFNFASGNGLIDQSANVTIDATYVLSPFVSGTDTDATFNIDNVSVNPTGSITAVPEPTFGFLSFGALALIRRRRR
jgi:hypothetical protein